jgi:hypothetical protein
MILCPGCLETYASHGSHFVCGLLAVQKLEAVIPFPSCLYEKKMLIRQCEIIHIVTYEKNLDRNYMKAKKSS